MSNLSRRDVLRGSAATIAGLTFGQTLAQQGVKSGRPRIGVIGSGGKGWSGMMNAAEFFDVTAVCDVDVQNRTKAMIEFPRASGFDDYREMIGAMRGKIDAVIISTPDHHHAPAAALAMRAGLHTYGEKPLTRTIWEARQLQKIAKEKKVATQMGNQGTANYELRKMAALIKSGAFGAVKEIHLWTDRAAAYWKQGIPRPAPAKTPKGLDWETWLGPRPERPYAEGYHSFSWRGWWDFGSGALGDMGCHVMNMSFMALDLRDPIAVQAKTSGHNRDSFPDWSIVTYEFGARNGRAPLTLFWYDGGKKPDQKILPDFPFGGNGIIIVCEKDTIYAPNEYNTQFFLLSGKDIPDMKVEPSPGHMKEFYLACMGGPQAVSNFPGYAGPLTETVLIGNLAIWADGPRLEWDAKKMKVKGTNEYDALIRPQYRPGWSV